MEVYEISGRFRGGFFICFREDYEVSGMFLRFQRSFRGFREISDISGRFLIFQEGF